MKDYLCSICEQKLGKEQSKLDKSWWLFTCKKCKLAWAVRDYKDKGPLYGF